MVEPNNDFERAIIEYCQNLAEMLILKNRAYGDSFREMRMESLTNLGSSRYPLWLHMMEKLKRYKENNKEESEDIPKDGAGYWILEAICSQFDDAVIKEAVTDYRKQKL